MTVATDAVILVGYRAALARMRTLWMVLTGLATILPVGIAAAVAPPPGEDVAAPPVLALLLFLGGSMHVASSAWLVTNPVVREMARRRPGRFLVAPGSLVVGGAIVGWQLSSPAMAWVVLAFFGWQFWHFQKQNLGMVALVGLSRRPSTPGLSSSERHALLAVGVAGSSALLARPELLNLRRQVGDGLSWLWWPSVVVFVAGTFAGLVIWFGRPPGARPTDLTVAFVLGFAYVVPLFVFDRPNVAVGSLTIVHGLQYLVIMSFVAGGDPDLFRRTVSFAIFVNLALIGGLGLAAMSRTHGASLGGSTGPTTAVSTAIFGAYLGLVAAHFVVDAAVWRLRDPDVRGMLSDRVPALIPSRAPR